MLSTHTCGRSSVVEHLLPKQNVVGSIPIARSNRRFNLRGQMAAKFGTSGLRGLAIELVGAVAISYTRAFLQHLKIKKVIRLGDEVYVAQDFRASSAALCLNIGEAIAAEGMAMRFLGEVPTQALAYEAMAKKCACIMITGSHIPADRNGLKFYRPDGEIDKSDEAAIIERVAAIKPIPLSPVKVLAGNIDAFEERYKLAFGADVLKDLRIAVYQHSTVARDLLVALLSAAGAKVTPLARSENFTPVDTEAISSETMALLNDWAASGNYDAIVSADGDGDRPLVADNKGQVLRGDQLGLITAKYLGAKTVVTPITSNSGIDQYIRGGTRRTRVGSPYVIAEMMNAKKDGAPGIVGFEANGGFFTASRFRVGQTDLTSLPTRDCFLPIFAVLSSMVKSKMSLSALADHYLLPVALADRLENFPIEASSNLMRRLVSSISAQDAFFATVGKIQSRNLLDGLRFTFADGSIAHLRPSGNAPEFRCYVEAATSTGAQRLLTRTLELISAAH